MFNPTTQNQYILDLYPVEDENTPKENALFRGDSDNIPLFKFTRNEYYAKHRATYDLGGYYSEEDFELKHLTEEEVRVGVFVELFEPYTFSLLSLIAFPFDYFFTYPKWVQGRLDKMAKEVADVTKDYSLDREMLNNKGKLKYTMKLREDVGALNDNFSKNKEIKETKAEALNELRMYLYANNLKLEGEVTTVLKNSAKQVNFGKNANSIINNAFAKHPNDEYVIIEDKDFLKFENKLKELFQEDIKVLYY